VLRWHRRGWRAYWRNSAWILRCPHAPGWRLFLRQHAATVWTCDFFCVRTILFRTFYVFFVIHHASRQVLHVHVTPHPTDGSGGHFEAEPRRCVGCGSWPCDNAAAGSLTGLGCDAPCQHTDTMGAQGMSVTSNGSWPAIDRPTKFEFVLNLKTAPVHVSNCRRARAMPGSAPVTRRSGKSCLVMRRRACNRRSDRLGPTRSPSAG
jgi:hypothetical protein